ncbi:PQQ-binding-like beta-propeller repeat protein [Draconibacterium sp. IB214405]|uniref:outer membrane protein assembly factor BamB family protein n=1 Tax=Draconibacterium sp. IB214405 TaxID=3097352 RepID=UPI002A0F3616|nr:PQQ-binding-like beta-propeller repeat protein [Draconibacterium sp. IB214405]MDX8337794.1 PQQ-binding-like beta-propeller repeat protein [Draconibacterium sp. IB214405]
MKKLIFLILILTAGSFCVVAQDWPQFMGPDRNSIVTEQNLLRTWPESGPEVLWRVDVGIGYGGPVVKDGKAYLLDRDDKTGDLMRCFDLNSGEELWKFEYESAGEVMFPGSRSVPIVDDKHVYSCGPYGHTYCIDLETHQPVWSANVWTDFSGTLPEGGGPGFGGGAGSFPTWAISQCPLIYGDLLILAAQAPEAGVVAYDKNSGELKWKTPSLGLTGYVSPIIVKIDGNDHLVMITASGGGRGGEPVVPGSVVGMDPLSGEVIWEFKDWVCRIPVPSAVDAGDNKLLIAGGYELGALMIQVEKQADGTYGTTELFRTEEFGDQTKTPLFYDGYFYAEFGTNSTRDGLTCMNMDGEIMWKTKRDPDFNKGSMIIADGLILATDGTNTLYLIEPSPEAFKPIAKAEILGSNADADENAMSTRFGGKTQNWAPIALADGKLLIRDQKQMLCVQVGE